MIHHLARAFFIRHANAQDSANKPPADGGHPSTPASRPVKARPITPWGTPSRQPAQTPGEHNNPSGAHLSHAHQDHLAAVIPMRASAQVAMAHPRRVRISTDPADARRTVITGRFAEVCAALDRLVLEQEATTA